MNYRKIYDFYYPKNYFDLIKNIAYSLKKIQIHLDKKNFRNKCDQQSLRICLKIIESSVKKQNFKRSNTLFKIIQKYHKYWC
jgi:ribosomal protein S20